VKTNNKITHEQLLHALNYDPETGLFTWRILRGRNQIKIGDVAGNRLNTGYVVICYEYQDYLAHRLAWLYMTGEWPKHHIDHINQVRNDNRFINLRESTASQNLANVARNPRNTSGFKGVALDANGTWRGYVTRNYKQHCKAGFKTPEEAAAWVKMKRVALHGEFASDERSARA